MRYLITLTVFVDELEELVRNIQDGNDEFIDKWLEKFEPDGVSDSEGQTPLLHAAIYNIRTILQKLLDAGADVNHRNHDGNTALHLAAAHGNDDVLEELIPHYDSLFIENNANLTPLHIATDQGHDSCVQQLINESSFTEAIDKKKEALKTAYTGEHTNCMRMLFIHLLMSTVKLLHNVDVKGSKETAFQFNFSCLIDGEFDTAILLDSEPLDAPDAKRHPILQHPTTLTFISIKTRILRPFIHLLMFVYVLFSGSVLYAAISNLEYIKSVTSPEATTAPELIPQWILWLISCVPILFMELLETHSLGLSYFKALNNYLDMINCACFFGLCPWVPLTPYARRTISMILIVSIGVSFTFYMARLVSPWASPVLLFKQVMIKMGSYAFAYLPIMMAYIVLFLYTNFDESDELHPGIRGVIWFSKGVDSGFLKVHSTVNFILIVFIIIVTVCLTRVIGGIAITSHVSKKVIQNTELAVIMQRIKLLHTFERALSTTKLYKYFSLDSRGMRKVIVVEDHSKLLKYPLKSTLGYNDHKNKKGLVLWRRTYLNLPKGLKQIIGEYKLQNPGKKVKDKGGKKDKEGGKGNGTDEIMTKIENFEKQMKVMKNMVEELINNIGLSKK